MFLGFPVSKDASSFLGAALLLKGPKKCMKQGPCAATRDQVSEALVRVLYWDDAAGHCQAQQLEGERLAR